MPILEWLNKGEATKVTKKLPYRILKANAELSYGEQSENMIIKGDNLEALQALLPYYKGQVKCIYIDPPYNTGSAFEHYDDNLEHSVWLSMIYPRLELLRDLLSEDGSIWISIDDRESAYLKVICDEVFGRKNFVSAISWQRTYSPRNDAKGISSEAEQILVYSKNVGWSPNKLPRTAKMDSKYKNPDNDICAWTSSDVFAPEGVTHQGMVYAIQHPFTGELIYPYSGAHWAINQDDMLSAMQKWAKYTLRDLHDDKIRADVCGINENEVRKGVLGIVLDEPIESAREHAKEVYKQGKWPKFYFTNKGQGGMRRKTYLDLSKGRVATNLWIHEEVGHTDEAKKEVKAFDSTNVFATPKPERLIQRVIHVATNEGDLVLDSFLGSGTTCAVAQKMGRRYIGIEMGEHAVTHCVPRMKAVIDGEQGGISKTVNWNGGGGYTFYDLGETIFDENGNINKEVDFRTLASHIWFTETKTPLSNYEKSPLLGIHNGVAYYLLFNGILGDKKPDGGNVLTQKVFNSLPQFSSKKVIYGEATRMNAQKLKDNNIVFKQTPYDVKAR